MGARILEEMFTRKGLKLPSCTDKKKASMAKAHVDDSFVAE